MVIIAECLGQRRNWLFNLFSSQTKAEHCDQFGHDFQKDSDKLEDGLD